MFKLCSKPFAFLFYNLYIPLDLAEVVVDGIYIPLGKFKSAAFSRFERFADVTAQRFFVQPFPNAQKVGAGFAVVDDFSVS